MLEADNAGDFLPTALKSYVDGRLSAQRGGPVPPLGGEREQREADQWPDLLGEVRAGEVGG